MANVEILGLEDLDDDDVGENLDEFLVGYADILTGEDDDDDDDDDDDEDDEMAELIALTALAQQAQPGPMQSAPGVADLVGTDDMGFGWGSLKALTSPKAAFNPAGAVFGVMQKSKKAKAKKARAKRAKRARAKRMRAKAKVAKVSQARAQISQAKASAGRVVRTREPVRTRELILGLDSVADIAAAATQDVTSRPQVVFRPDRVVIPASIAPSFLVLDIRIGKNSQFTSGTGVPAETFAQGAFGVRLKMDTAQISQDVLMRVTNVSLGALRFNASMIGPALE